MTLNLISVRKARNPPFNKSMQVGPLIHVVCLPLQVYSCDQNLVSVLKARYPPFSKSMEGGPLIHTVKRVDEVVRHPHLVTQDQNTQVSNKVSDISRKILLKISNFSDIFHKYRTSSTELESLKSMQHAGPEPAPYRITICHSTTAPCFLINFEHNNTWCT